MGIRTLLSLIIGIATGILQFMMLAMFTKAIASGVLSIRTVVLGICQFLIPLAVLLLCAFLFSDALLWVAIGMVAALVISAFARSLLMHGRAKGD